MMFPRPISMGTERHPVEAFLCWGGMVTLCSMMSGIQLDLLPVLKGLSRLLPKTPKRKGVTPNTLVSMLQKYKKIILFSFWGKGH
jgi:hypothetical protein